MKKCFTEWHSDQGSLSSTGVYHKNSRGFALIGTLLLILLLTSITLSYLEATRMSRLSTRALLWKTSSEMATTAGIEQARSFLLKNMASFPYHSVGFKPWHNSFIPIFLASPHASIPPQELYLISGVPAGTSLPMPSHPEKVDINTPEPSSHGWIGNSLDQQGNSHPEVMPAFWVYLYPHPDLPENLNSSHPQYNPPIARFAYWIEDECSKLDVSRIGNTQGTSQEFLRSYHPVTPNHFLNLTALPLLNGTPLNTATTPEINHHFVNQEITSFYQKTSTLNLPPASIQHASPTLNTWYERNNISPHESYLKSKRYWSTHSLSNELTATGTPRVNLNALITPSSSSEHIAADIADIFFTITGKHTLTGAPLFPGVNLSTHSHFFSTPERPPLKQPLPSFPLRFYPDPSPPSLHHQELYLKRISANIRDLIDPDSFPTVIDHTGSVASGNRPAFAWLTGEEPQAIGKESIPYLQEHMWRGKEIHWKHITKRTIHYTIELDHYFEFFNPSPKDFTAPPGTFLKLYNFPSWLAGSFPLLTPEDFEIDLSGTTFPAGSHTVITTDPSPPTSIPNQAQLIHKPIPLNKRQYSGYTDEPIGKSYGLQLSARTTRYTDYETEFVFGHPQGYFDAHAFLGIPLNVATQWNFKGKNLHSDKTFFYSSSLRGNDAPDRSGDPRSLSEQLAFKAGASSLGNNQTRFYSGVRKTLNHSRHTLGAANIPHVDSRRWADYHPHFSTTSSPTYTRIPDAPLTFIGDLGSLYDPARKKESSSSSILHSRGGGRTLKIGQNDDLIGSSPRFSPIWNQGAWHLCDLFTASPSPNLLSPTTYAGKININTTIRDNGTALRAALHQLTFPSAPDSSATLAGKTISDTEVDHFITSIIDYLYTEGPFMSRGEIGQITCLSPTGSSSLAGKPFSTLDDSSREALARYLIEIITTRSSAFSIYCLGESIRKSPSGKITILARSRQRVIDHYLPTFDTSPLPQLTTYQIHNQYTGD